MPIHDHSYRHWEGELRSHALRWWVIAKAGLRITLRHKLFLLFIMGPPAIHVFGTGAIIYGINTFGFAANIKMVNPKFFFDFFTRQYFFVALICMFGGSGLIANDLKNNALQLYLSKPLTRLDYLTGKLSVVMVLIGFLTVVPGILLFIENAVLSEESTFLRENYWLLGSILLYSIILALPTGLLILALSAATRSSNYAAVSFIVILVGTPIFSEVLDKVLHLDSAVFVSYWSNLNIIGKRIFGLSTRHHWSWAMLIILGIIGLCVWIMHRRVKGVEIVN